MFRIVRALMISAAAVVIIIQPDTSSACLLKKGKQCESKTSSACYKVYTTKFSNWAGARDACASEGHTLATITSDGDNNDAATALNEAYEILGVPATAAWIGLNDVDDTDNALTWVGTGEALNYSKLLVQTNLFDCVAMEGTTQIWSELDCSATLPYICQSQECFYSNSFVYLPHGIKKKIGDVKPGDKVMSINNEGQIFYDEVYLQTHRDDDITVKFIKVTGANDNDDEYEILLTPGHIITTDNGDKRAQDLDVMVDKIYAVDRLTGDVEMKLVVSMETVEKVGITSPLTLSGKIVVDDLIASVYSDATHPVSDRLAHFLMWPGRSLYRMMPAVMMMSDVIMISDDGGRPAWLDVLRSVLNIMLK